MTGLLRSVNPRSLVVWLLLAASVLGAQSLLADEAASLFARGNQLYTQGDYEGAVEAYQAILERGYESWQVYYNLGNAYYKLGEVGKAILNFERARRLNPRDEDIRHNLELANLKVVDRIHAIPELMIFRWLKGLARLFSATTLGWVALTCYGLGVFLWIARLFVSKSRVRSLLTAFLASTVVVWLLVGALAGYRLYLDRANNFAIVLVEKVDARSAPESTSTEVFVIHEGVKVRVERQENGWTKIRLADGKVGWIPAASIERI